MSNISNIRTGETFQSGQPTGCVNPKSARMQALPQVLAVSAKNLLLLSFGLTLAYPTILIPGVTDPKEVFNINEEGLSWIGSINLICVPIGCIISGVLSEKIGRRRAMQVINIPFVVAWLLFYFSNKEWHIFTGLAITGLTGGSLEAPILTYVSEVCQPHIRGTLASISVTVCFFGFTVMFVLGMFVNWRNIALTAVGFHVVAFMALFFVPESPHWLIKKNRIEQAKKSLAWLRGWTTVEFIEEEYREIYQDVMKEEHVKGAQNDKLHAVKQLLKKDFLWPYALVCYVFFLSHFCGISTLLAYAVPIFITLNSPINILDANGILGIMSMLGCITNSALIYFIGKRVLMFISLIGMAICYFIIGGYAELYHVYDIVVPSKNGTSVVIEGDHNWLPTTLLIIFMYLSHVGVRLVPWILASEVFNSETRASAAGLCSAATYIMNFVCNKTYFTAISDLTFPGIFFLYAAISTVGCVITYYVLPETEGKNLIEINDHFLGKKDMGNHVYRKPKNKDNAMYFAKTNHGFTSDDLCKSYKTVYVNPSDVNEKVNSYDVNP